MQIDLAFGRANNVITLCEMKRHTAPLGKAIIAEVERKAAALQSESPRHTIQKILIVDGPISKEISAAGYFFQILGGADLMK